MPVKRVDEVGGVECDICELIIKEAEQLFLQNSTEVCLFVFNWVCLFVCLCYHSKRSKKRLKNFVKNCHYIKTQ